MNLRSAMYFFLIVIPFFFANGCKKDAVVQGKSGIELTPVELTPVELTPVELAPVELTPVALAPVELAPIELTPIELTPIELITPSVLSQQDILNAGITDLRDFTGITEILTKEQMDGIGLIRISNSNIESFSGIDKFTQLQSLYIEHSTINNFDDLVLSYNNNWLTIKYSVINSLKGLDKIKNLIFLSLEGCSLNDYSNIVIPGTLKAITLENFSNYYEIVKHLPESIREISLNGNGITSLADIEFLQKFANVRVFIDDDLYKKSINENLIIFDQENNPRWKNIEVRSEYWL